MLIYRPKRTNTYEHNTWHVYTYATSGTQKGFEGLRERTDEEDKASFCFYVSMSLLLCYAMLCYAMLCL